MTFASDWQRRDHFLRHLGDQLETTDLRTQEGGPQGSVGAILAMSDPPYFTACPNPYLGAALELVHLQRGQRAAHLPCPPHSGEAGRDNEAAHLSLHAHTHLPFLDIRPLLEPLTYPGDVVLIDRVGPGQPKLIPQWGASQALLSLRRAHPGSPLQGPRVALAGRRLLFTDPSPQGALLAAAHNQPFDERALSHVSACLGVELLEALGWMYETRHTDQKRQGLITSTIWGAVGACPSCSGEIELAEVVDGVTARQLAPPAACPGCGSALARTPPTPLAGSAPQPGQVLLATPPRRRPLLIAYQVDQIGYLKQPDSDDLERLDRIAQLPLPPCLEDIDLWPRGTRRRGAPSPHTIRNLQHLFMPRAAQAVAQLWKRSRVDDSRGMRALLGLVVEQATWSMAVSNRYRPRERHQHCAQAPRLLHHPLLHAECSPFYAIAKAAEIMRLHLRDRPSVRPREVVMAGCQRQLEHKPYSVDHVLTIYAPAAPSDRAAPSRVLEALHGVARVEAPAGTARPVGRRAVEAIRAELEEHLRGSLALLRPRRRLSLVLHTSDVRLWNVAVQALACLGLKLENVRPLLGLQAAPQGGLRSIAGMIFRARAPAQGHAAAARPPERATLDEICARVDGYLETVPPIKVLCTPYPRAMLDPARSIQTVLSKVAAEVLQSGWLLPLTLHQLVARLGERSLVLQSSIWLPHQAVQNLLAFRLVQEDREPELFAYDEPSARRWIREQLLAEPRTYEALLPRYLDECCAGWKGAVQVRDLGAMLELSFLRYSGVGEVPRPLQAYLTRHEPALAPLAPNHPEMVARASGLWYVPDPDDPAIFQRVRAKMLLGCFARTRRDPRKRPPPCLTEALHAGFQEAFARHDYQAIVEVARKLPPSRLRQDPLLSDLYQSALRAQSDARLSIRDDHGPEQLDLAPPDRPRLAGPS